MSEHVLCMVLYLIELGLDNQVQDNKEDEVRSGHWQSGKKKHFIEIIPLYCGVELLHLYNHL